MYGMLGAPVVENKLRSRVVSSAVTLDANNTTASVDVFNLIGSIEVRRLWGVVTVAIGANHTAGFLRLDDGAAQVDITASGITLSGLAVGTTVTKEALAASSLTLLDDVVGTTDEGTLITHRPYFMGFVVVKKTGAGTAIEYRYSTTDAPTSGELTFYAEWLPLSDDGDLSAS